MKKILFLLLCLCLAQGAQAAEEVSSAPLYQAAFTDLTGQPFALNKLKGKVTVINFWAAWCPPCRREIPDLITIYDLYRERGVAFLGIAVEDNRELIQEFARAYNMNYPLVTGKEAGIELMQKLGNPSAGLPFTLVLDARGNIVASRRGPMDISRLEEALQTALKAKPASEAAR